MKALTNSEHAVVLFALRYLISNFAQAEDLMQDSGHFEQCDAPTAHEVDELCKRLNHDLPVVPSDEDRKYLDELLVLGRGVIDDEVAVANVVNIDPLESLDETSDGDDGVWVRAWVLVPRDTLVDAGLVDID